MDACENKELVNAFKAADKALWKSKRRGGDVVAALVRRAKAFKKIDPDYVVPTDLIEADGAVATNTSAGFTATTSGQGIVFAGATRIRGMLAANVAVAGLLEFKDGSQTGDTLVSIVTTSGTGNINTNIPQDGILFRNGAFLDMQATQVVDGLTVLFDG